MTQMILDFVSRITLKKHVQVSAALLAFSLVLGGAGTARAATEITYRCEVIIAAADVADGGAFTFVAPLTAGVHGGTPLPFTQGAHEVQVIADAQWLGISWTKSGVKVAEALFALAPLDRTMARVGILYDPNDSGDQVSLNCSEAALTASAGPEFRAPIVSSPFPVHPL